MSETGEGARSAQGAQESSPPRPYAHPSPRLPEAAFAAERWVGSVRRECLDHFVVFSEEHLRYLVTEYAGWYNERGHHQGVGNRSLSVVALPEPLEEFLAEEFACEERLGAFLKHYHRRAAA
jgi:hypothetical protein